MADWLEQYSAALAHRDQREQVHKPYIDAFTAIADRTALQQPTSTHQQQQQPTSQLPPTSTSPSPDLSTLRLDLASTHRARLTLQTTLTTLQTAHTLLQTQNTTLQTQLTALARQTEILQRRLRDREDELRGKKAMVEHVQDEMVALQLQLSMCEQKREGLEAENRELVERWVRRMGEEVERVNREGGWE